MRRNLSYVLSGCLCFLFLLTVSPAMAMGPNKGEGRKKECICHIPPGNPDNAHTICVGSPAVSSHLAHGDTLGSCVEVCGGASGAGCDEGQYCHRPEGECADDAEGICADLPNACPTVLNPVCGCDGVTYDNECFAASAGATVASEGDCDAGLACGGSAGDTCEATQYCKREEGECGDDAEGVCTDTPMSCAAVFDPVCGCDGVTYDNDCFAAAAGATVASAGDCDGGGEACGGELGDTCMEGQFCKADEGMCAEDAEGTCTDLPSICPAVFDPVCGCDGRTYSHECMAEAAGVSVEATGECGDKPQACGGTAGDTCEEGQYCKTADGECSMDADGLCADLPTVCALALDPVCGCDGMTYGNACFANGNGVNIASAGECDSADEICDDGQDNDDDSLIDCDDPDCAEDPACTGGGAEICNDGQDNDGDTLIDCADDDCVGQMGMLGETCEQPETSCSDSYDNDGDNVKDCADPDCAQDPACTGGGGEICNDGQDNDADSLVDCADDDCIGQMGMLGETCEQPETSCSDNYDNDGDNVKDCSDPDCAKDPVCSGTGEVCNDGQDNDGDSRIDCADDECIGQTGMQGETCEQPEASCADGYDNDGDGDVDCADSSCAEDSACLPG